MKEVVFKFNNPEESSGYLLWQLTMLWQRKIKKELDALHITHTQFVLLAATQWLCQNRTLVTQVDIANHSNTDRMMVSKVLRTLEANKLIIKTKHKTDTRSNTIVLTIKGKQVLQKALLLVEHVDTTLFSTLGKNHGLFNKNMIALLKD
jgi:DNA-binding MarR family transcriptional regulator